MLRDKYTRNVQVRANERELKTRCRKHGLQDLSGSKRHRIRRKPFSFKAALSLGLTFHC